MFIRARVVSFSVRSESPPPVVLRRHHDHLLFKFTHHSPPTFSPRKLETGCLAFRDSLTLLLCLWRFSRRLSDLRLLSPWFIDCSFSRNLIVSVTTLATVRCPSQLATVSILPGRLCCVLMHRGITILSSVQTGFQRPDLSLAMTGRDYWTLLHQLWHHSRRVIAGVPTKVRPFYLCTTVW